MTRPSTTGDLYGIAASVSGDAKVKHLAAEPFAGYFSRVPALCGRFYIRETRTRLLARLPVCKRCTTAKGSSRAGSP